jgi:hypothetical protein
MPRDRDIEKAIKAGERNRDIRELVHNWCTNARVKKFGGTGLIELETGLPIGHHSMECDYAPAGGMATWDLAASALHFYDNNCVGCKHRVPHRLPNLIQLVIERDAARDQDRIEREQEASERQRRLAGRQEERDKLRLSSPHESATIFDLLDELDRKRTSENDEKFVQTAKLAPEIFTEEIIDHLFSLLEKAEGWFLSAGLQALSVLNADAGRLTNCAMQMLARGFGVANEAATIALSNVSLIRPESVPAAVRSLVMLAHPPPSRMSFAHPREPYGEPLFAVYRAFPEEVRAGVHQLLSDRPTSPRFQ